jgi:hypothetical protein
MVAGKSIVAVVSVRRCRIGMKGLIQLSYRFSVIPNASTDLSLVFEIGPISTVNIIIAQQKQEYFDTSYTSVESWHRHFQNSEEKA